MTEQSTLPPSMPLPAQISQLQGRIKQLQQRIEELTAPTPQQTREQRAEQKQSDADDRASERQRQIERAAAAEIMRARAVAIRAIAKLVPQGVAQAKKGKPALLRMILRATR